MVNVECSGSYACDNLHVDSQYAYQVGLICTGTSSYPCNVFLEANYADTVIISSDRQYGSYGDQWNVKYAKSVTITGKGYYALYNSVLHAENAGSITIELSAIAGNQATYSMDWYISDNSTKFMCYGAGMTS